MVNKFFAFCAITLLFSVSIIAFGATPEGHQPSKWKLNKSTENSFEMLWQKDSHHIAATECGGAYLDAPKHTDLKEGDCWTFHIPAKGIKKGTYIEVDLQLGNSSDGRVSFAFEYLDGKNWISKDTIECTGLYKTPYSVIETFKVNGKSDNGEVKARLRALQDTKKGSNYELMPYGYIGAYCSVLGTDNPTDTTKIGWIGNSFTFVSSAAFILKELAWYEGHYLDINVSTYPGAYLRTHFGLQRSMDVISEGGYDYFILQDQSGQAAKFGCHSNADILQFTEAMANTVRYFSPGVAIILEQTWAFKKDDFGGYGSFEAFDRYSEIGAEKLADKARATVSPIAPAFAIVREERPDIELYSTDNHHSETYGSYLKACVDYLTIFNEPFKSKEANYALDPEICEYLRSVAERVVLKESESINQ